MENQRDIIIQINNNSIRDEILSLARKEKTLQLQKSKVLVFPDTPAKALQRRKSLKETVTTLRNMGQKYKWATSGRLVVIHQGTTYSAYDERLIQAIKKR
ncbi:UNVERIFIED_CONTAM: hypothetical protein K2H54_049511 [Gekko kuhli]